MVALLLTGCLFYGDADRDRDGDGELSIAFGGADCNDDDADISPSAAERCNEVDDDCNGEIDEGAAEGAAAWYPDVDGDGYGDDQSRAELCEAPKGYMATGGDCDDASAAVNPTGVEQCNEIDDDCDGEVDEDATDAVLWYADADGDSYGDPASTLLACSEPANGSGNADDCDDSNATVNPGAEESVCTDDDDDCNGSTESELSYDHGFVGGDVEVAAGFGEQMLFAADFDGFGPAVVVGAPGAGEAFIFSASASHGVSTPSTAAWAHLTGSVESGPLGALAVGGVYSASAEEDDDVLVAAPGANDETGALYFLQLSTAGGDHTPDDAFETWEGSEPGDRFGEAFSFFDATGASVLVVGAPGADEGRGTVYLLELPTTKPYDPTGILDLLDVDSAGTTKASDYPTNAGFGSATGGWRDSSNTFHAVASAPKNSGLTGLVEAGTVALWQLGTFDAGTSEATSWSGASRYDHLGSSMLSGDLDGDGPNELLIAAPDVDSSADDDVGAVYVIDGEVVEANAGNHRDVSDARLVLMGNRAGFRLGQAMVLTEIDGAPALVLSATNPDCTEGEGVALAVSLTGSGVVELGPEHKRVEGRAGEQFGASITATGDPGYFWFGAPGSGSAVQMLIDGF